LQILAAEEAVPNATRTDLQDPLLPVDHTQMSKSLSTLSSHHTDSVTESIMEKEDDCEQVKVVEEDEDDDDEEDEEEGEDEEDEDEDEDEEEEEEEDNEEGEQDDISEEYSINESQVEVNEQEEEEKTKEMMEIAKETGSNKVETTSNLSLESSHIMTDQEEEKEEATIDGSKAQDKSDSIVQPTVKAPAAANTMEFLNSSPPSLLPQKRGDKSILRKSSAYFTQKIRKAKLVKDEPVKTKFSWWRKFRLFARD
jgi:hypothetical protein